MQQKTKLGFNFGFRGWMLMIFQIAAFVSMQVFTNFPMNMLGDFYGGAAGVSTLYTVGMLVGIVLQLVIAPFVPKMKSVKAFTMVVGAITILGACGVSFIPFTSLGIWKVCYFIVALFSGVYCTFGVGILVGQWFPTRKGVFMGIATFAFPIANGLMGPFANTVFATMATTHQPNISGGFLPFLIFVILGWIIGLIFTKDYPEQCGCYRDNDKSFTKEKADAMLAAEIENKRTTVWKLGATLKSSQFWLVTIPMGALLMCSVGMMTQTDPILAAAGLGEQFDAIMAMVMIFALIGSYVLGLVDGKWGTKLAITISVVVMLLSGILGGIGGKLPTIISMILLSVFMGAGSNFVVSAAAQYWRREDFPSVYAVVNPVANVIQCFGPMMVAMTVGIQVTLPFWVTAIIALVSLILILCFKPSKVKATDDKYRAAAGKPLDDALVGRK